MRRKKNLWAKFMAIFALIAIVVGIVGTAVIFIVSAFLTPSSSSLTEADLQSIIESFSGAQVEGNSDRTQ